MQSRPGGGRLRESSGSSEGSLPAEFLALGEDESLLL